MEFALIFFLSVFIFFFLNMYGRSLTDYESLTLETADNAPTAFNFIYRIIGPNVILIIVGAIIVRMGVVQDLRVLWLSVPLQFVFRIFFNFNRLRIFDWTRFTFTAVASSLFAYLIGLRILSDVNLLLPEISSLSSELWLAVIIYSYIALNTLVGRETQNSSRTKKFVVRSYEKLNGKYGALIQSSFLETHVERFIYAILVTENFNRPFGVRLLESFTWPFRKTGTYGLMQVRSSRPISDEESIKVGIKIVSDLYEKIHQKTLQGIEQRGESERGYYYYNCTDTVLRRVAWFYNRDDKYSLEVMRIYEILNEWLDREPELAEVLDEARLDAYYSSNR